MPSFLSCFGCAGARVAPNLDVSRDELKSCYEESIRLNGGRLIVHGLFARADTRNNNRRVYPMSVLKREAARFEHERINSGTALGEVDHPSYNSNFFRSLNLANISHQVLEIHWSGDQLLGTIEILPTPSGLMLWELYRQGIKLGVSSRGWASLRKDRKTNSLIVEDDFDLITFDFVTDPSTHEAYLLPIPFQCKTKIPDQTKVVHTAHLGHGTCSIGRIAGMPEVALLASHIKALQAEFFGMSARPRPAASHQVPPPPELPANNSTSPREYFDRLLRYSHYMVYFDAAYLEREEHERDYLEHLSDFIVKAHLWDQCQPMNKKQRDSIIKHVKGSGCQIDRRLLCQSPPIGGMGRRPQNFGEGSLPSDFQLHSSPVVNQQHSMNKLPEEARMEVKRIKNTLALYAAKCGERQEMLRNTIFKMI